MSKKDSLDINLMFGKDCVCLTFVEQRGHCGFCFAFDMQYVSICILGTYISCEERYRDWQCFRNIQYMN